MKKNGSDTLITLLGPTGVGKTDLALRIARTFHAPVISADSRQLYRDLPIGTAAPTPRQMEEVKHYMVGILNLDDYYSASRFETDVLALLEQLFRENPVALLTGGSMMYIDAVCNGIDDIPTVDPEVRRAVCTLYEREGLAPLLEELRRLDPVHYDQVDKQNYRRVIHAVEICRTAGRPYSSFRTAVRKPRPFRIVKIGLARERGELCERINRRVDEMMAAGLLDEARKAYLHRHLNALNTVGYKELFRYLDGEWPLDVAVEKIKRNTRVYARKQMTWFRRDPSIAWFSPGEEEKIIAYIREQR